MAPVKAAALEDHSTKKREVHPGNVQASKEMKKAEAPQTVQLKPPAALEDYLAKKREALLHARALRQAKKFETEQHGRATRKYQWGGVPVGGVEVDYKWGKPDGSPCSRPLWKESEMSEDLSLPLMTTSRNPKIRRKAPLDTNLHRAQTAARTKQVAEGVSMSSTPAPSEHGLYSGDGDGVSDGESITSPNDDDRDLPVVAKSTSPSPEHACEAGGGKASSVGAKELKDDGPVAQQRDGKKGNLSQSDRQRTSHKTPADQNSGVSSANQFHGSSLDSRVRLPSDQHSSAKRDVAVAGGPISAAHPHRRREGIQPGRETQDTSLKASAQQLDTTPSSLFMRETMASAAKKKARPVCPLSKSQNCGKSTADRTATPSSSMTAVSANELGDGRHGRTVTGPLHVPAHDETAHGRLGRSAISVEDTAKRDGKKKSPVTDQSMKRKCAAGCVERESAQKKSGPGNRSEEKAAPSVIRAQQTGGGDGHVQPQERGGDKSKCANNLKAQVGEGGGNGGDEGVCRTGKGNVEEEEDRVEGVNNKVIMNENKRQAIGVLASGDRCAEGDSFATQPTTASSSVDSCNATRENGDEQVTEPTGTEIMSTTEGPGVLTCNGEGGGSDIEEEGRTMATGVSSDQVRETSMREDDEGYEKWRQVDGKKDAKSTSTITATGSSEAIHVGEGIERSVGLGDQVTDGDGMCEIERRAGEEKSETENKQDANLLPPPPPPGPPPPPPVICRKPLIVKPTPRCPPPPPPLPPPPPPPRPRQPPPPPPPPPAKLPISHPCPVQDPAPPEPASQPLSPTSPPLGPDLPACHSPSPNAVQIPASEPAASPLPQNLPSEPGSPCLPKNQPSEPALPALPQDLPPEPASLSLPPSPSPLGLDLHVRQSPSPEPPSICTPPLPSPLLVPAAVSVPPSPLAHVRHPRVIVNVRKVGQRYDDDELNSDGINEVVKMVITIGTRDDGERHMKRSEWSSRGGDLQRAERKEAVAKKSRTSTEMGGRKGIAVVDEVRRREPAAACELVEIEDTRVGDNPQEESKRGGVLDHRTNVEEADHRKDSQGVLPEAEEKVCETGVDVSKTSLPPKTSVRRQPAEAVGGEEKWEGAVATFQRSFQKWEAFTKPPKGAPAKHSARKVRPSNEAATKVDKVDHAILTSSVGSAVGSEGSVTGTESESPEVENVDQREIASSEAEPERRLLVPTTDDAITTATKDTGSAEMSEEKWEEASNQGELEGQHLPLPDGVSGPETFIHCPECNRKFKHGAFSRHVFFCNKSGATTRAAATRSPICTRSGREESSQFPRSNVRRC
ncbi:hypothetical protein CBR_g8272 [Chara braunii]|uniref:Uncharacterized protein n=1 Tax=Chara braunii TaxID=69332 RepID=A0A388KLQ4_CHABU|nr:hypothetical protein CBR_g8272 [Chara braunii]|eukprot:GBG70972.1 hypothetical protein CBR_g8272 [Chara braunii]